MKKIFTFCALILSAGVSTAQVNAYFLNNPQWKVKTQMYSGSDCFGWVDTGNYSVNGDSLIGSFTYKKIWRKGIYSPVDALCNAYSPAPYAYSYPSYYMRSAGKQMFVIEHGNSTEFLLYDFDLNVGDTVPASYTVSSGSVQIVTAIDSFSTASGYRKRFQISGSVSYLYEGIGTTAGLVEPAENLFLSGTHDLLCFSMNDVRYLPGPGGSCDIFTEIEESAAPLTGVVYPNPFSESATFQFSKPMKNASFCLFNSEGQIVKSLVFSGEQLKIEREDLGAGLYYFQAVDAQGKIQAGKIIITK